MGMIYGWFIKLLYSPSLKLNILFLVWFWFDFCFTALQHILGHFGRGQLTYPHCSWASLLGSLPVLRAHSFASNWQLLLLNGRRNVFMTKSPWKNVPDVGIELGSACMPSEHFSDRATATGLTFCNGFNRQKQENDKLKFWKSVPSYVLGNTSGERKPFYP